MLSAYGFCFFYLILVVVLLSYTPFLKKMSFGLSLSCLTSIVSVSVPTFCQYLYAFLHVPKFIENYGSILVDAIWHRIDPTISAQCCYIGFGKAHLSFNRKIQRLFDYLFAVLSKNKTKQKKMIIRRCACKLCYFTSFFINSICCCFFFFVRYENLRYLLLHRFEITASCCLASQPMRKKKNPPYEPARTNE